MSKEEMILSTKEEVKPATLKTLPDLKALREERGLTIEDVSLRTRMSASILNSIEKGEFQLLPPPVYTNKFIQIYADTVGIDAGIILAHYQRYLHQIQIEREEIIAKQVETKPQRASGRTSFPRYLLYIIPVMALIAIVIASLYFFFHGKEAKQTTQNHVTVEKPKEVVATPANPVKDGPPETTAAAPQAPTAPVAQKEASQAPANKPLDLTVEATEDTWLSIAEDRNPPNQVSLKKGDKLSREAREFFIIDVGNAAGVKITFLGKPLGTLGGKGEVVHLRLPRQ